jgi:hypothetical protein
MILISCTTAELHDPKHQPDMAETVRGKPFGIPVEEFTKEVCVYLHMLASSSDHPCTDDGEASSWR